MNNRAVVLAVALCAAIEAQSVVMAQENYAFRPVGESGVPPAATKDPPPPAETSFYYYGGEAVPIERSRTECLVKFRPGSAALQADLLSGLSAVVVEEVRTEGRAFQLVKVTGDPSTDLLAPVLDGLRNSTEVEFVANVYLHRETGTRLAPTDEIVVKLRPEVTEQQLADIAASFDVTIVKTIWGTSDEFVLRLNDRKGDDPLEKSQALHESGHFLWAEPNFIREYRKFAVPNDPRFGQQWHLRNTGQGGGVVGADIDAPVAWDIITGNPAITIGIVDDGVEITHEDLAANIFTNPGETPANGIDDDGNGYIDDVNGWDFSNNDNDPTPFSIDDNHGTAVAGVAAARGNNATGVTGACQTCKILPVKIFSPNFAGDTAAGNAIRYAGMMADVVNNSWGGGSPSAAIQSAIQDATIDGRGGKGTPVLFATGNSSSGMFQLPTPTLPAGTHRFRFTYSKDFSVNTADDTAWLAWVIYPGNTIDHFQSGIPAGWTTGGSSAWTSVVDPRHSDEGRCYTRAARAGALTHNQSNYLEVVKSLPSGVFIPYQWISSEAGFDGLTIDIDLGNDGIIDLTTGLMSGVPFTVAGVSYPAAYPESIAVGSSSNFDCRSHYSQYGAELDFVAPSSAGPTNLRIETTDRMGSAGYDASNYTLASGTSGFGGTSSATPLASGVAGLILSRNPNLTRTQLKQTMENTAEKVGPEPYVGGRNDRYGYGRINANNALLSISPCATITLSPVLVPPGQTSTSYVQPIVATGGTGPYTYAVTVGSLPPGLTLASSGTISGSPSVLGSYGFSIRATDANGCSGYRAFNVTITTPPAPSATSLYIVTPCRVIDTRLPNGPSGGPALPNLGTRNVQIGGVCGVPVTAKSAVANVTAVSPTGTGFLALYPAGSAWPGNSHLNYRLGRTRANNAVLRLSAAGQTTIRNSGPTQHFIIDVTGYFE